MGIAARIGEKLGRVALNIAAGRQEAIAGVLEAKKLSASLAVAHDRVGAEPTPHAPDQIGGVNGLASASLQAPKAAPGRSLGVNAAGPQRPNLRVAAKAAETKDKDVPN